MKLLIALSLSLQLSEIVCFVVHRSPQQQCFVSLRLQSNSLEEQIRSMSARSLKKELDALQVSTNGVFEKEELVARYLQAVERNGKRQISSPTTESKQKQASETSNIISVPLYLSSNDKGYSVTATNSNLDFKVSSGSVDPVLKLTINGKTVTLILDTACSDFILRPSAVKDCKLNIFKTSASVSGAGGLRDLERIEMAELECFQLGEHTFRGKTYKVVLQDIDVLANVKDGMIGLSFLRDFAAVDLNFAEGQLVLYRHDIPPTNASQTILASHAMTQLEKQFSGLYHVPVMLGNRGPVNMLVDSGATSSILSWKGLADLGMDASNTSFVQRLSTPTGAMGVDRVAMDMTHRIHVSSSLKLATAASGPDDSYPGVSLAGDKRLAIDIGRIPILDALGSYGVGGILGMDVLLRISVCRLCFKGEPTITFF
jgi:predicted aspartyl protease